MATYFYDRLVEHPGRIRLTSTSDQDVYDVSREEGTVYDVGTPLNATNLNGAYQDVIDQIPTKTSDLTNDSSFATTSDIPVVQYGRKNVGNVAANTYVDVTVTFSESFSSTPTVVVSMESASTSPTMGSIACSAINITTTGFTIRCFNDTSSQRSPYCAWIAVL